MKKKISVFAGNNCNKEKEKFYFDLAYKTGKLLAENNFVTITGAGEGLMEETANGNWFGFWRKNAVGIFEKIRII